ncbi:MAG: TetR/AcrR family transcriptional regulator [Propionibacteriaceae bacterium]|nr:TetR/AcrR family transcriptional regulator [Propionibacteriaceae bacterium]
MARLIHFSHDDLLDAAAAAVLVHWRSATVRHVQEISGAPSGSIYHRFPSRDALFGALWERSIRRFHAGLFEALKDPDPHQALLAATAHVPRFCREHPSDAKAMTLYRLPDLVNLVPETHREELRSINDLANHELASVTQARYQTDSERHYQLALVATRQCPYGMIRPMIGQDIPLDMDDMCLAAAEGILALGDKHS